MSPPSENKKALAMPCRLTTPGYIWPFLKVNRSPAGHGGTVPGITEVDHITYTSQTHRDNPKRPQEVAMQGQEGEGGRGFPFLSFPSKPRQGLGCMRAMRR